jgi:hypothetical protein
MLDSLNLSKEGFAGWQPFSLDTECKLVSSLPRRFGVYAIRSKKPLARFQGRTDLAYIGRAANSNGLKGRIRQHMPLRSIL